MEDFRDLLPGERREAGRKLPNELVGTPGLGSFFQNGVAMHKIHVRRMRFYLDDDLWHALYAQAKSAKTTISELVREAVRERYACDFEERQKAMQDVVGIWRDRQDIRNSDAYVRRLRKGVRLDRLEERSRP
jgi:hypothetical protein